MIAEKSLYDALAPAFNMKRKMIAMRKQAGPTQEQMAELLGYSIKVEFEPANVN